MDRDIELANAIKTGELELICPEMELLVCPSHHESALKGTGVIRSDDRGTLYFRMVSPLGPSTPRHKALFCPKPVGELYDPEDLVMLRAIDQSGMEWRSNPLRVDLWNEIPIPPNLDVSRKLASITHSGQRPQMEGSFIRIVIPNVRDLPFDVFTQNRRSVGGRDAGFSSSLNHHKHRIGGAEVDFHRDDERFLSVSASQAEPFLSSWSGLMCHALGFALAETLRPVLTSREFEDRTETCLHSGPFLRYRSHLHSPVPFTGPQSAHFWKLIELFLKHIEKHQSEPFPLLDELQGIREGARGSLQTACLTLAVSVESIAGLVLRDRFSSLVPQPPIQPLMDYVDSWNGDADLKDRAKGALSQLTSVRAVDLMYAWAKKTETSEQLIDAWKKLRHQKAHGKQVAQESGWDLYCTVVELLHRIVAYAIGYDGPLLLTSQPGWGLNISQNRGLYGR